jgi:predicted MPP superfamily phosphohydrolase
MYVCRGIGTVGIPARFFAPPEVAAFDWRLA